MNYLKDAMNAALGDKSSDLKSPANNDQDLVAHIKNKLEQVRSSGSRVANEGTWLTNAAYALGYSSVYYDTVSRQYRVLGNPNSYLRRNRISINKILPTLQRRLARLCKNIPKFEVRPDDGTEEARDAARLEKKVLLDYWEKERIQEKRLNTIMGSQQFSHYYMHVCWDTEKGDPVGQDENGNWEYEGDIGVDDASPFEMFPDPLAKKFEDCQWVIRARVRKLDYFKTRYPEKGIFVKEEQSWMLSTQYEARIQSLVGQGMAQTGTIESQMKNTALEIAYYEKRSSKHPDGRLVVISNDLILEDKPLPVGEIPFSMFCDIPIAGKYYPEAVTTHLRPIQDQYNRLVSQRTSWTNKMLAGKYLAPRGADLDQESINDQSGEVVYYSPVAGANPPGPMAIPVIPQYAYTEEDRLNSMFYDIAGEGEVSRGILPSASIPAIGMQLLLEQDETRISVITEQHEHAFARLAKLILLYAEKYVTNEKMIKLAGPNEQYTIKTFKGEDIQTKHDVIVVRGSLAPASSAVRRNDIVNAWQSGLYGMPQDPMVIQKVFKSLEFGDVDGAWEDQALDEAQIKYTLQQIDDGLAPDVHELDNHPLHIAAKNRFRKTDKYRAYDTHRQALILADIEEHLRFMTGFMAAGQGQPPDPNVRAQNQSQGIIAELSTAKNNTAENQLRNETMNQSQSLMGAQPGGQ